MGRRLRGAALRARGAAPRHHPHRPKRRSPQGRRRSRDARLQRHARHRPQLARLAPWRQQRRFLRQPWRAGWLGRWRHTAHSPIGLGPQTPRRSRPRAKLPLSPLRQGGGGADHHRPVLYRQKTGSDAHRVSGAAHLRQHLRARHPGRREQLRTHQQIHHAGGHRPCRRRRAHALHRPHGQGPRHAAGRHRQAAVLHRRLGLQLAGPLHLRATHPPAGRHHRRGHRLLRQLGHQSAQPIQPAAPRPLGARVHRRDGQRHLQRRTRERGGSRRIQRRRPRPRR